jgi:F-type H+-transporting ATPase subunit a
VPRSYSLTHTTGSDIMRLTSECQLGHHCKELRLSEEIHLTGSPLIDLGPITLTNTWLASIVVVLLLIWVARKAVANMKDVPGPLQNAVEFVIESLYDLIMSVSNSTRKTRIFFPLVATFFIYILTSNYFGLLPGVGTIGFFDAEHHHFTALLRSPASDLNTTLALAFFSVIATHYYSLRELGVKGYLAIWFSLNPILLFVGILELVGEVTKVISLSFRLFGNIFAGEAVLEAISSKISPFLVTLPFYSLELIVGFVQALVFSMLTLASLILLTSHHGEEEHA